MKKASLLFIVLIVLLLAACTSKEQKAYEEGLQQAKDKITAEEFDEAQDLLTKALNTGFEESTEVQNLLDQLQQYEKLESLLSEGKFEEVYKAVEAISQIKNGSTVITTKAIEFKEAVEQEQQQFNELQAKVDESLKLVEDKKYEEANGKLKALNLTEYKESYFLPLTTVITETITSNEEEIAVIKAEEQRKAEESRQKAEAEKKAKEEAASKNNMLNWTYEELDAYMSDYFGMKDEYVMVDVYDRTSSGYQMEVRQNNAAMGGEADPDVSPMLGMFEVRVDGKLYKSDYLTGEYIPVN